MARMRNNIILKENIKKYKRGRGEIDVNDVLIDIDNESRIYSLKDDFEDIKHLIEVSHGFIDRNFLLNEIVVYNTEETERKELLKIIMEDDDLVDHFMEISDIEGERTKVIINTLPLLPDDWLEENMSFFVENVNILFINSERVRKIYFEEVQKNGMSGVNGLEDCVCSMYNYMYSIDKFDFETIENIKSVLKLFKAEESFFQIYKNIQPEDYKKDLMDCFLQFKIKDKRQVNNEVLKKYLVCINELMSEADISLEDLILTDIRNDSADIFLLEPSFFKVVSDRFMHENKYDFVYELFVMCRKISESPEFVFVNTTQDFDKNKKYLFLINSEVEKNKIMESLREPAVSTKHTVKRL